MEYVNTALAAKANDDAVVHLANTETITGTKSLLRRRTCRIPWEKGMLPTKVTSIPPWGRSERGITFLLRWLQCIEGKLQV